MEGRVEITFDKVEEGDVRDPIVLVVEWRGEGEEEGAEHTFLPLSEVRSRLSSVEVGAERREEGCGEVCRVEGRRLGRGEYFDKQVRGGR